MEKLKVEELNVNFNSGGDYVINHPNITKEFNTREEVIKYINSKEFYDVILDYLEENGEDVDEYSGSYFESYSLIANKYGASIILTLNDEEEISGEIYVEYQKRKGYVISDIEYELEDE